MTHTSSAPDSVRSAREVFTAISGLIVGMFVAVLSGTVVSTSMPVIIADLGGTQSQYTWVITAALLATAWWSNRRRLRNLAVALVLAVISLEAMARDLDQDEALRLRREGLILPLETLIQRAMERYPGARLLEAELEEEDGRYVYEIELLTTQGVARELEFDARDGRLIKDEED